MSTRMPTSHINVYICICLCVCLLAHKISTCDLWHHNRPLKGLYCDVAYNTVGGIAEHICVMECIRSPTCLAINYNTSSSQCMYIPEPCHVVQAHNDLVYVLFTDYTIDQCITWVNTRYPDRSVAIPGNKFISRFSNGGDLLIGHAISSHGVAYAVSTSGSEVSSSNYVNLAISSGCTTAWVMYKAGSPMPKGAIIGGNMLGRGDGYVARITNNGIRLLGAYYVLGETAAYAAFLGANARPDMELLIVI